MTYTIVIDVSEGIASDHLHEILEALDENVEIYPGRLVGEDT